MEKQTYLITGGSGFLGNHLGIFLLAKGVNVRLADINPLENENLIGKVEFMQGDIRNSDFMEKATEGVDVVIHAAASLPIIASQEQIRSTNVGGTQTILQASLNNKVKKVIHISTTAVYGVPKFHPIFETSKIEPLGPYGETKWEAEGLCREFRKKGLFISIIRPKTFLGPERLGVFQILFDWVRRGKKIYIIGSGKNRYQLLNVADLIEAIWLAANSDKSNTEFNIGANEFATLGEDLQQVLDFAKSGSRLVPLPAKPVQLILRFLEITKLSPLVQWQYETMDKDSFVEVSKAEKILGWKPKKSNSETLIENYEWYVKHWRDYEGKVGTTHKVPWDQKILKLVRLFS
ncbi:MAG: NAD(P)-dependent oxidoreductase [DPANN group archaeon]|nr:NAD(P)-dependent oxidoreductase [DPANN group archaeon]